MGKTIIQTIGPLYGEVVNGTVFGRPNGSVFIPSANTITATMPDADKFVRKYTYDYGDRVILCDSAGNYISSSLLVIAESQDVASSIGYYLEDSDSSAITAVRYVQAGVFNTYLTPIIGTNIIEGKTIEQGADYNIVISLYSLSGVPVATTRIPVKGVVVE